MKTYNFFDKKGRRCTIEGQVLPDNKLKIVSIPCSRNDFFCKKKGSELLRSETSFKNEEIIDGNTNRDFLNHCNSNYYKAANLTLKNFKGTVRKTNNNKSVELLMFYKKDA